MKFEIAPPQKTTYINDTFTYDDARLFCFAVTIDGKTGWRLPTLDELRKIYELDPQSYTKYYWSSTPANSDNRHMVMFFHDGFCTGGLHTDKYYILPVRDLKDD